MVSHYISVSACSCLGGITLWVSIWETTAFSNKIKGSLSNWARKKMWFSQILGEKRERGRCFKRTMGQIDVKNSILSFLVLGPRFSRTIPRFHPPPTIQGRICRRWWRLTSQKAGKDSKIHFASQSLVEHRWAEFSYELTETNDRPLRTKQNRHMS